MNFKIFQKMSIAIVTGANKGIGLETCRALAKSGNFSKVYLTSRNVELGETALADIRATTTNQVNYHQLDISNQESVDKFKDYINQTYGGFDVLGIFIFTVSPA